MLVIEGFLENGVFIPQEPLAAIKGRQRAVLNIDDENEKRLGAWQEFSRAIRASDEALEREPERIRLKTIEEIEAL